MNKLILVALLALTFCIDKSERFEFQEFQRFLIKYNKQYNTIAEYFLRFNVFKKKFKKICSKQSLI